MKKREITVIEENKRILQIIRLTRLAAKLCSVEKKKNGLVSLSIGNGGVTLSRVKKDC